MNKIIPCLLIGVLTLTGLSSCKKDYVCTCTTASGTTYDSHIKTTKHKAKKFCDEQITTNRTCALQ